MGKPVIWEGTNPIPFADAFDADEPTKVRVVSLKEIFNDGRFGMVMVQGFIESGANAGWQSNYGERVVVQLLLDEVKSLQDQLAQVKALPDKWEADARTIPVGAEDEQNGMSIFNWYMDAVRQLRRDLEALGLGEMVGEATNA